MEEASGFAPAELAVGLDEPATVRGVAHFDRMLGRRLEGEPLQYVLGSWGFRTLDLMVDRRVLIPRPETEAVVGHALVELDRLRSRAVAGDRRPVRVVDLGTGSGAVALSLAAERDRLEIWATDASDDALDVARANLAALGMRATGVRLAQGSWFEALPPELAGTVDLVISNPPYVAEGDDLAPEVARWEPEASPAGRPGRHRVPGAPGHRGPPLAGSPGRAGARAGPPPGPGHGRGRRGPRATTGSRCSRTWPTARGRWWPGWTRPTDQPVNWRLLSTALNSASAGSPEYTDSVSTTYSSSPLRNSMAFS